MPTVNADVAAVFDEIADLLEIQGSNTFRVRAYRNAARLLTGLGKPVAAMADRIEDLDALPGIGADLAGKIQEIVRTGHCALLDRLRKEVPPSIAELLKLPGLGPKRVRVLHDELGVQTLEALRDAAEKQRIRGVHGFGERTESLILEAVRSRLESQRRVQRVVALQVAEALLSDLKSQPGVERAEAAGSLRRGRDTVGDLDLVLAVSRGSPALEHFAAGANVQRVLARGSTRASVVLRNGLQVDVRAVPPASFGAAWLYFTGSKPHNIQLRRLAQDAGLKLNEYGLYRGERRIAAATEESIYRALGLPWIDPALREDRGEIDAARAGHLPSLVRLGDLRGDLHAHTSDSDGHDGLEAMALAARRAGLQYLAITDHSKRLAVTHGLDTDRLLRQIDRIDEINAKRNGIVLLKGVEVDILEDGSLDLPNEVLSRLDLVVGAVHQHFDLPRERQTERLMRAMDAPHFSILAHPTGRLIDERGPCDIDLRRLLSHARARGCFVELNAQPARLDLDEFACRVAKEEGVLVSIASDAHRGLDVDHLRHGIDQARRGWLEARDVLNTRSLAELRPLLDASMGRATRSASSVPVAASV